MYVLSRNMKNIKVFIQKLSVFSGEIFNIFEYVCFVMMFLWRNKKNISTLGLKVALSGAVFTLYMAG